MKCFIVTKAHHERFRVLPVIKKYGWQPSFACDTDVQAGELMKMGVPSRHIYVTSIENAGIQGVSLARDYVVNNVMPKGEWCVWIDDNVGSITGLQPGHCNTDHIDFNDGVLWRQAYQHELTPAELRWHFDQTIARAESVGTIFAAFANETNYYFRGRHWQDFGYCRTQLALYKNDGSTWMPFPTMMLEDMYKSIDVVTRYGQVVINRYVKPIKPMFENGGIGSFERRLPWLQDNCEKLMALYPGLLKYDGDGKQYGLAANNFHVTFAKRSKNTVNQWRKEYGYA
jgi:hypothetical protein